MNSLVFLTDKEVMPAQWAKVVSLNAAIKDDEAITYSYALINVDGYDCIVKCDAFNNILGDLCTPLYADGKEYPIQQFKASYSFVD